MRSSRSLVGIPAAWSAWMLISASAALSQEKPILTATAQSPTSVQVAWTAPAGATAYKLQRRPDGGTWSDLTGKVPQLAYTDLAVLPATTYAYRVRAFFPEGEPGVSVAVEVTTPPSSPGGGSPGGGSGSGGSASAALTHLGTVPSRALAPAPTPGLRSLGPAAASLPLLTTPLKADLRCDVQGSKTGYASDWNLSHTSVTPLSDDLVWLRLTFRNHGGAPATNVPGGVSMKLNGAVLLILGSFPDQLAASVPPGSTTPLTPFSIGLKPGVNTLEVTASADPGNAVSESNEANNGCSKTFQLQVPNL